MCRSSQKHTQVRSLPRPCQKYELKSFLSSCRLVTWWARMSLKLVSSQSTHTNPNTSSGNFKGWPDHHWNIPNLIGWSSSSIPSQTPVSPQWLLRFRATLMHDHFDICNWQRGWTSMSWSQVSESAGQSWSEHIRGRSLVCRRCIVNNGAVTWPG